MMCFLFHRLFAFLFFIFLPVYIHAVNVSIIVIETGSGAAISSENAGCWEDNIMDVFFNEGHIVSNARSKRIAHFPQEEIPEEALRDLQAAQEGGSEFFVIALLNYSEKILDGNTKPETIILRLYRVNPYTYMREETVIVQGKTTPLDSILTRTRIAAKNMISYMRRK
jgi:hypothetical protein